MKVRLDELKSKMKKVCKDNGLTDPEAETVVSEYLDAELRGRKSHGVFAFLNIVDKIKKREGNFEVVKEGPSYALIDGKGNLGQIVGNFTLNLATEKAKKTGIAMVGMFNMNSYQMPGTFARKAVEKGMIGIIVDNARSRVAPYGGIEPRMGTNPIAIGIPGIIIDMATAKRAMGEIILAQFLDEKIPKDWGFDRDGKSTDNPNEFNTFRSFGEYKGYALGLAIEILAGIIVRAKMGSEIQKPLDRGFLFIVIDPRAMYDFKTHKEDAKLYENINKFIEYVKSSKLENGFKEILIPGERSEKIKQRNLLNGHVEIHDKIMEKFNKMIKP